MFKNSIVDILQKINIYVILQQKKRLKKYIHESNHSRCR